MSGKYRLYQTWVDKARKPMSAFTILRIYERAYENGDTATRIKGILVCGVDGAMTHKRDMDSRSFEKMFPVLRFDPERRPEYTPQ